MKDSEPVIVGTVGAPHGVRGWVKVNSFTEPGDNIFTYPLLLAVGNTWQPIEVEQVQMSGGTFIAKLAHIADRDQAALITNAKLAVQRADLPDLEDETYWTDMMGLSVYNQDQVLLGVVTDIFATGANDVLVVTDAQTGKEHLIPCVLEDFVLSVDLDAKRIQVQWDPEF